jgi:NDP-sugar pyrophosphorylase family protein
MQALPKLGEAFFVLYGDSYLPIDYHACAQAFLASGKHGLMTVYENHERYDASNVWFADGKIKIYDKKNKVPEMHHIDYGLGLLQARAFDGWPRNEVVDLADVYKRLVAENQLAGLEIKQRFYEIGSHAGLQELDTLFREGKLTA